MRCGILQNDEAVSPILGAVLLLAIGITIITNVQLTFVPVWNAQEDMSQLTKMNDDFRALKSSIEESAVSGTTISSPLTMGFKYSPKIIVYNPKETAWATLSIQRDMWAEVRYNEVLPDGTDDATSIKNVSTSTITYSLHGTSNLSSFIYEHGLIRRSGSNYTNSAQTLVANGTIYLLGVNATAPENIRGIENRAMNIYSTSAAKNSVVGKKVWLTLHTRYTDWWTDPNNPSSLQNQGGVIKKIDAANGIVIAYFESIVIRMGETQVTTTPKKPPPHSPPVKLVRVTPQNTYLPVNGMSSLAVEVVDVYNNPVPNVQVNFNINSTKAPANAYLTANLSQNYAFSGPDGRVNIQLKTGGPGLYYIDASMSEPPYSTTFVYPASSQNGFISLDYAESLPNYTVTSILKDGFGQPMVGNTTSFSTDYNATVAPPQSITDPNGNSNTVLNISTPNAIKLTNILASGVTKNSAIITWDSVNPVTVAVNRTPGGYIFNSIDIPAKINSSGCVNYGTTPGTYTLIKCDSQRSSHNVTLNGLQSYTAYYFIVNSSKNGTNVNSTEYMFVTAPIPDATPPDNISNIGTIASFLYINWTWNDPADVDFDHVEVYIDGTFETNITKGQQYFNATYFKADSAHTISTHTVDTYDNVNTAWVNNSASTLSVYTYVFDFLNTTGTVSPNFSDAQNGSDGGASAIFTEALVVNADVNNYTYVTNTSATNGTVTGFSSMQAAGDNAFATLTEGAGNSSFVKRSWFNTTNESWVPFNTTNGTVTMNFTGTDGNPAGSIYSNLSNAGVAANRTANTTWTSPNFTWTNGTPFSARLDFDWRVVNYTQANPGSYNVTLVKPDGSKVLIYPNTTFNAIAAWSVISNSTVSTSDFSQQGNYSIKLNAVLRTKNNGTGLVQVRWDDPTITLNYTSYSLNITTNTSPVPADTNYYLEINYSRDTNGTGYDVYIFNNGTGWNLSGTLNQTTWTVFNHTLDNVTEYNAGNPRIRYVDRNPTNNTRGNLYIDYQRIHGFTFASPPTYHLNITTNTTGIPEANTSYMLQLRYNVSVDNFTLQIWNGTSSTWNNRGTLNNNSMDYLNITLQAGELLPDVALTGGTVGSINTYYALVRYLDVNASGVQGTLYLDYQRVFST